MLLKVEAATPPRRESMPGVTGDLLIVTELSGLLLVSYAAVWHYRSPDLTPWPIALLVFGTWYLGFMGTLLLPIDLAEVEQDARGTYSSAMLVTWHFVYWSTFCLTWFVLPVVKEFWYAGDFTVRERLRSALIANLKWFFAMGLFGALVIGYMLSPFGPRSAAARARSFS